MLPLRPFKEHNDPIGLEGDIKLIDGHNLHIEFRLVDPQQLVFDSLAPHSERDLFRANELWHSTCFEAFWGVPGENGYWELNLSASQSKWNLYRFNEYRKPFPPEESRDFEVKKLAATKHSLTCQLSSAKKFSALEASLCVILRTSGTTHYYATNHAGAEADYHLRKSFTLQI
ncbi:MAG: hypothetical protein ACXWQO_16270 [Bdellovibrionota bacterium]